MFYLIFTLPLSKKWFGRNLDDFVRITPQLNDESARLTDRPHLKKRSPSTNSLKSVALKYLCQTCLCPYAYQHWF